MLAERLAASQYTTNACNWKYDNRVDRAGPGRGLSRRTLLRMPQAASAKRHTREGGGMAQAVLGIIGGSGIYDLPGLANVREERVASPWGEPSGPLRIGDIDGLPVVFVSRHDKGHRLSPSDINYRANIDVMKRAGVTDLVSLSACGSFKE